MKTNLQIMLCTSYTLNKFLNEKVNIKDYQLIYNA